MGINNTFNPDYSVHPGEFLDELIDVYDIEQAELAMRLGITPKHLSNIVNGKASITAKTAVALEYIFPDRPVRYWLGLQNAYDEFEARKANREQSSSEDSKKWLERFDFATLEEAEYIPKLKADAGVWDRTCSLLTFFGCSSIAAWKQVYGSLDTHASGYWDERGSLSLAWMRKGQINAAYRAYLLPRFERRAFGRSLRKIETLVRNSGEVTPDKLQEQCEKAGVLLTIEKPLPTMKARSASFWMRNTPVVQLRADFLTDDEPLLDFAREAAEILKGKTYSMSLHEGDWSIDGPCEDALEWLTLWERSYAFAAKKDYSSDAVRRFAKEEGVHPGIVVGLLQRRGIIAPDSSLNSLKSSVSYGVVSF